MNNKEYKADVSLHQTYVFNLIQIVMDEIEYRQATHDKSKFDPEEAEIYAEIGPKLKAVPFGSPEYYKLREELGPALKHHYENNRHHPEHFENGIAGMTLIDLIEMVCDWVAAARRRDDANVLKDMEILFPRFGIKGPLAAIILNTARDLIMEDDNG